MYKLKITILFSCMIVISIIPSVSNAIAYNELVPHVAKQLGVSDKVAEAFIRYVYDFTREIQKTLLKLHHIIHHNILRVI